MSRRLVALAAAAPLIALPSAAFAAVEAPPSEAEAVVAEVEGVVSVSETYARAAEDEGTAKASVLELGGEQVIGSEQEGDGESSDALIDTGESESLRVQVAPSEAKVVDTEESTVSDANAAVARAQVGEDIEVDVLESSSHAEHNGSTSSGKSSSNGAEARVGEDLHVLLLHAESDSNGESSSYVASINGEEILTSEQIDQQCLITVPDLLAVDCVSATGGEGEEGDAVDDAAARVVGADLGADGTSDVVAVGTSAGQEPAAETPGAPVDGGDQDAGSGADDGTGNDDGTDDTRARATFADAASPTGTLPLTGADMGVVALAGLALAGAGGGLLVAQRRA